MSKNKNRQPVVHPGQRIQQPIGPKPVPSLLDAMEDGNEYGSIVSLIPQNPDVMPELRRAVQEIERVRGRPCVVYIANLIRDVSDTAIHAADHLPFCEMVARIPASEKRLDIFIATPGGSAEQVNLFVEAVRPRFEEVDFLVPYKAMSAGTLWALAGDKIWMDSRAFLGPLDPQVPSKEGTYVPAQALLMLLKKIQDDGQAALNKREPVPWSLVRLLDQMDQRQLGAAMSATSYVINMASTYLEHHKFKTWDTHRSTKQPVTPEEKKARAKEVAQQLASHDKWKAHGHAISRDILWQELKIQIDHPESFDGLQRAMRRLWALAYYTFDKLPVVKMMISAHYAFVRSQVNLVLQR
jgi:hypothetical protein